MPLSGYILKISPIGTKKELIFSTNSFLKTNLPSFPTYLFDFDLFLQFPTNTLRCSV